MKSEAEEFLKLFQGNHHFCAGDDLKEKKGSARPWKENVYSDEFAGLNRTKYAVYYAVNRFPKGTRSKDFCQRIRALYVDDDVSGKLISEWPLEPSIVVQTSHDKYNYYWLTSTTDFEKYDLVQQTMVDLYNGDKNARDISRVLRLPGYNHNKGKKFKVKVIGGNQKKYPWSRVVKAFPPAEAKRSPLSDTAGKFSMDKARTDFVNGENFHGSMASIAMSMAERGRTEQEYVDTILSLYMQASDNISSKTRLRELEDRAGSLHIKECWDSAVKKKTPVIRKGLELKPQKQRSNKVPDFPVDFCKDWPEPWPKLWEAWKKVPGELDECILAATFVTAHAHLLNCKYTNYKGRFPNINCLVISPSTAGKDENSKEVIEHILHQILKDFSTCSSFKRLSSKVSSLTSDTALLNCVDENGNFYWMNTEATRMFQQMSSNGNNADVQALSDVIISIGDGRPLASKGKADKNKSTTYVKKPNVQSTLFAQPETIRKYITQNTINSGLGGRLFPHISISDISANEAYGNIFSEPKGTGALFRSKYIKFYRGLEPSDDEPTSLKIPLEAQKKLDEKFRPMMINFEATSSMPESARKFQKRIGMLAEYLYVAIMGIAIEWRKNRKLPTKIKGFNIEAMFPLVQYYLESKLYMIHEFAGDSVDSVSEAIISVMKEYIRDGLACTENIKNMIKEYHAVTEKTIIARIKRNAKYRQQIGEINNLSEQVSRNMKILVDRGDLVVVNIENAHARYYGFS